MASPPSQHASKWACKRTFHYFSKDGSDDPFEFVLSNLAENPTNNSVLNDPSLFDAKATAKFVEMLLAEGEVRELFIDPGAIEAMKTEAGKDFTQEEKVFVRGENDNLIEGSRRDMDAFMMITLNAFLSIERPGSELPFPDGKGVHFLDPDAKNNLHPIFLKIQNDRAETLKIELGGNARPFKLYLDPKKENEIMNGDTIPIRGVGAARIPVFLEILSESKSENDIRFTAELLNAEGGVLDRDTYQSSAITASIFFNDTKDNKEDDFMRLGAREELEATVELQGPSSLKGTLDLDVLTRNNKPTLSKSEIKNLGATNLTITPLDQNDLSVLAGPYALGVFFKGTLLKSERFDIFRVTPNVRFGNDATFYDGTPVPLVLPSQGNIQTMSLTTDQAPDNRQANDIKVFIQKGQLYLRNNLIPTIKGSGVDGVNLSITYNYYSNYQNIGWHDNLDFGVRVISRGTLTDYFVSVPDGRTYHFKSVPSPAGSIIVPGRDLANVDFSEFRIEGSQYILKTRNGTQYFYDTTQEVDGKTVSLGGNRIVKMQDRLGNSLTYQYGAGDPFGDGKVRVTAIEEFLANKNDPDFGTPTGRSLQIQYKKEGQKRSPPSRTRRSENSKPPSMWMIKARAP